MGKQNACKPRWTEKAGWRGEESCMTPYDSYTLLFSIIGLTGQYIGLGLIFYGIRQMQRGTEYRERESVRRHKENMTALNDNHTALMKLIERTGG